MLDTSTAFPPQGLNSFWVSLSLQEAADTISRYIDKHSMCTRLAATHRRSAEGREYILLCYVGDFPFDADRHATLTVTLDNFDGATFVQTIDYGCGLIVNKDLTKQAEKSLQEYIITK